MVKVIPAQNITLGYLKEKFALQKSEDQYFFPAWYDCLPKISALEKQYLDRVKNNYLSLCETTPLLEEAVKMVVLSPLLDLAGFYRYPFHISTEESIEISESMTINVEEQVESAPDIVKGKIDVLVIQNKLWILIIESKRPSFSVAKAIPQALTYMIAAPDSGYPVYSLIMNGEDFQFIKIIKQNNSVIYALSDRFTLYRRENELYIVISILKNLSKILI
jgi:hypothetical protein